MNKPPSPPHVEGLIDIPMLDREITGLALPSSHLGRNICRVGPAVPEMSSMSRRNRLPPAERGGQVDRSGFRFPKNTPSMGFHGLGS